MAQQKISIQQTFDAPIATVFNLLTDHESFGKLLGANIKRVKEGHKGGINGLGSVRQIIAVPVITPPFEEEVITFEQNKVMEYTISKGSPIKNHLGRMVFSEVDGKTQLDYTIVFEPKLCLPLIGPLLKKAIEDPIRKGFNKQAQKYAKGIS